MGAAGCQETTQGGFGSSWAQLTEQLCQDTQPCAVQPSCAITSGALSHTADSTSV